MTTAPISPVELFYSYAHADEKLRKELEKHLSLLKRQGYIADWHDRDISAGKERQHEIDAHLNAARIILLLISPDFMASDYCYDIEVKRAIERHRGGEVCVIPIILRPVDWQGAIFGTLKALPEGGKPVTLWSDRDAAFYNVVQGIRDTIEGLPTLSPSQINAAKPHSEQRKELLAVPHVQQSVQAEDHNPDLERPATAFLSYAREDAAEVKYLQQQLKVRGVRAWRDVTDLPLGGSNEEEIVRVIKQEADAFVIYITPRCLASTFIWATEVPAALWRWERDHAFHIIPILHGVTFSELQQHCTIHGYRSLTEFNGVRLSDTMSAETAETWWQELRSIAERTLRGTLTVRLQRIGVGRTYEPWICLRTFRDRPTTSHLDLELDWWELFRDRERMPSDEEWRELLLPALLDVKNALGEHSLSHKVRVSVQAILPVAFALGFAFPASSSFTLLLEGNQGTWSTRGTTTIVSPLRRQVSHGSGDHQVAVIEIAIASDTTSAVAHYLSESGLSYSHHIRYDLPNGPDHIGGIPDEAHALAMAQQIGKELRSLLGQGISHIHLFAAIPANLAVMIGYHFSALCPISLYQYAYGHYKRACVLGMNERIIS